MRERNGEKEKREEIATVRINMFEYEVWFEIWIGEKKSIATFSNVLGTYKGSSRGPSGPNKNIFGAEIASLLLSENEAFKIDK